MWTIETWEQFLAKACNYPQHDITADSKFLVDNAMGPSVFEELLYIYQHEGFSNVKGIFESLQKGNVVCLQSFLHIAEFRCAYCGGFAATWPNKLRPLKQPPSDEWRCAVMPYSYYYLREGDENFPRRCACAISPTTAVTFAHGRNQRYQSCVVTDGKIETHGTVLTLHHLLGDRELKAQVVRKNDTQDCILLEALDGATFFEGKHNETILSNPVDGERLLAIGLSADTRSQEAVTTGVVLSTGPFEKGHMISDIIAWGGDSGGGLYNVYNQLIGIVSASLASDDDEYTRTYFVPGKMLQDVWDDWMRSTGKIPKRKGIKRGRE